MRLQKLKLTEGVVIDQIPVRTQRLRNNYDVQRPQIRFFVLGTEYIFVDKNVQLDIGDEVRIAYSSRNPHSAYVYNIGHWIAEGFLVPATIFACFLFSVIWISGSDYGSKTVTLPRAHPI